MSDQRSSSGTVDASEGELYRRRSDEPFLAWKFDGQSTMPLWLIKVYKSSPLPEPFLGHYATATIEGDFWRWFKPEQFERTFVRAMPDVAQRQPEPAMWVCLVTPKGEHEEPHIRAWTTSAERAKRFAQLEGLEMRPLYASPVPSTPDAAAQAVEVTPAQPSDDCACGGGDISGHDTACPYYPLGIAQAVPVPTDALIKLANRREDGEMVSVSLTALAEVLLYVQLTRPDLASPVSSTNRGDGTLSVHLETLVREWRDAQREIDRTPVEERKRNFEPLHRLIAAHNALLKYANEEMGD